MCLTATNESGILFGEAELLLAMPELLILKPRSS
jgi:hypothetical protein